MNQNQVAMDEEFGSGNWAQGTLAGTPGASIFNATTKMVYLEGGDFLGNDLANFIAANQVAMQNWVAAGGRIFINAAVNTGCAPINLGFGITLSNCDYSSTASAANLLHPIFNGPNATAGVFSGNYYTHGTVSGAGLAAVIYDNDGGFALGEMNVGAGYAMFGGMTTDGWHAPQPAAHNLRRNILCYVNGENVCAQNVVPEPASVALMATGLVGIAGVAVRRRRSKIEA